MGIQKVDKIWIDGKMVAWDDATEHVLAHTLHYGVGAFEGIRAYHRADGRTAIFRLDDHLRRLIDSCHICTIDSPYTQAQIKEACLEVLRVNGLKHAYLRPLVYLGSGALGLGSLEPPVRTVVAAFVWGAYLGDAGLQRGIRARVSSYRRASIDSVMSKGKITGQYVPSVLAKREAMKAGYDEAILLAADGTVAEATGENLFMVRNGVVKTAPTSSPVLAGVTRDTLLTLARELGYDTREVTFTRDEMWTADEVFLCGTAAEVTPVREIDDRRIGSGEPGPVTRRLQDHFFKLVKGGGGGAGADGKHADWLTFV